MGGVGRRSDRLGVNGAGGGGATDGGGEAKEWGRGRGQSEGG